MANTLFRCSAGATPPFLVIKRITGMKHEMIKQHYKLNSWQVSVHLFYQATIQRRDISSTSKHLIVPCLPHDHMTRQETVLSSTTFTTFQG